MKCLMISLFWLLSHLGFSQNGFEVVPTYRKAITQSVMHKATSISEINAGYPASWIKEYVSVAVTTVHDGVSNIELGDSEKFTPGQLSILNNAELGGDLSIKVSYYGDSKSVDRKLKFIEFSYGIAPETMATYVGGFDSLDIYFKEKGISKLAESLETPETIAKATFTIDKNGRVVNVKIEESTGSSDIDALILKSINGMSVWEPALNVDGDKVSQSFALNVGMVGC